MKIRILQTVQAVLFIAIGAVAGHYQGVAETSINLYGQIVGNMQTSVDLAMKGKK